MTRFSFRSLAIGTLALLTCGGVAAAQSTPVLNTFDLQMLIGSGEPADNARLSAHFGALAERYAAEAARHTSMAQSFAANPNRNTGSGMSAHCRKLAELNTESAATLRELAAHHERLAAGSASTPPRGAGRFYSGAGASKPAEQDLKALAAKANTRSDHLALAEYFRTLETRYNAEARTHATIANAYRGTKVPQAAANCDRIATLSRDAAMEAAEAAMMHSQLAGLR